MLIQVFQYVLYPSTERRGSLMRGIYGENFQRLSGTMKHRICYFRAIRIKVQLSMQN